MGCHIQVTQGIIRWFAPDTAYPQPYLIEVGFIYDGTVATMMGLSHPKFTWQIGHEMVRYMKACGYSRVRWERKDKHGKHLRWVEF